MPFDDMLYAGGKNMKDSDRIFLAKLAYKRWYFSHSSEVVEVGAYAGEQTLRFAQKGMTVYAIDTWEGAADMAGLVLSAVTPRRAFQTFCRNMGSHLLSKVFPCVGKSQTWAAIWTIPVGFVLIDADHSYEAAKADIAAWSQHVKHDGIIACHDYNDLFPGVKKACDEIGNFAVHGDIAYWVKDIHYGLVNPCPNGPANSVREPNDGRLVGSKD